VDGFGICWHLLASAGICWRGLSMREVTRSTEDNKQEEKSGKK
jgi:hypothetical protein